MVFSITELWLSHDVAVTPFENGVTADLTENNEAPRKCGGLLPLNII